MRLLMTLALGAALLAGCSSGSGSSVAELSGIDALRTQFNEDAGQPRLILVLSPS
jgi:hypothetical protein